MLPTPGHARRAAAKRCRTPLNARCRTHKVRLLCSDACAAALLSTWEKKTSLFQRASLVGLLGGAACNTAMSVFGMVTVKAGACLQWRCLQRQASAGSRT